MTILTISILSLFLAAPSTATLAAVPGLLDTQAATAAAAAQEQDLVCGMSVDAAKAKAAGRTSEYEGKTYYFCNDSCKKQFDADPAKFVAQKKSDQPQSASGGCGCCCCRDGGMAGGAMAGGGMCRRRMP